MVRILLKSLLSLSLIAPLSAFAMGLGDVRLHTALGERLRADIDLLSVSQAEAEDVRVSLASQETFDRVGLERPPILMFLQFDVVRDAAGNYSIQVTSREAINEPFLDFLVEVDWKSGRVLREYTLLLDPPSSYHETPPAITQPSTASTTTTAAPVAPARPAEVVSAERPAPVSHVAPVATPRSSPAGGMVYGPVTANDTLWRIAEKMRPSSDVTVQQMMIALLKANPYAFFDNNINRLKRGYVLRLDDPSILDTLNKGDAAREVARQTRAWQDYREGVVARASQRQATATGVEGGSGAVASARSEPKLKLVAPEGSAVDRAAPSGAAGSKGADQVGEELMLAMEGAAAQRKENEALKSRLEALEGQLQDMEKIISLKDADLAALQHQLREQGKGVELPSEQTPLAVIEETAPVVKPEEAATAPQEPPAVAEALPVVGETAEPAAQPPVVKKPKPKKVAPPPVEEPGLIESLLADQMLLGIGGGALLFILILMGLIIKRRRKSGFQESILSGGTSSMMKANDELGSETSFLSDLAISGMGSGTMHTDEGEVDPLTEADVFMAYGRNQQAEEVLKKAREQLPERADVAAKLLEVYYNSKDTTQFEALAEEAVGILQGDDVLWGKVSAMGHELCPENVLFATAAGVTPPTDMRPAAGAAETVMDIGLDLDELTAEMEGEGSGGMDFDLGLDFSDLDDEAGAVPGEQKKRDDGELGAPELTGEAEESELAIDDAAELEMELGALELTGEAEETEKAEEASPLDFELDLGGDDGLVSGDDEEMDFALDLGELSTEEVVESAAATGLELDMGDFDLTELEDLDSGTAELETSEPVGGLDLDISMDDLGELGDLGELDDLGDLDSSGDEITTKLDLAQAYAEMGDAEGARSMLEEVIAAGSEEQKQQAQALIDKL
ncbi:MAG: hypothetical protein OQL08_13055 [Gammaproteobacteria bacterium]|nr:hypothetical protein [Gammaproteobacteria bacterium]